MLIHKRCKAICELMGFLLYLAEGNYGFKEPNRFLNIEQKNRISATEFFIENVKYCFADLKLQYRPVDFPSSTENILNKEKENKEAKCFISDLATAHKHFFKLPQNL